MKFATTASMVGRSTVAFLLALRCLASSAAEQPVGARRNLRAVASTRTRGLSATSSTSKTTCSSVVDKDHPDCVEVCTTVTSVLRDGNVVEETSEITKKPCGGRA